MAILKKVGGKITKVFKKGDKKPVEVEQHVQVVKNDGCCDKCKCKDKDGCNKESEEIEEVEEEKDSENDE